MENDLKSGLENFLSEKKSKKDKKENEVVIEQKTGLVEKVEKTLVLTDGRILLREQDYR